MIKKLLNQKWVNQFFKYLTRMYSDQVLNGSELTTTIYPKLYEDCLDEDQPLWFENLEPKQVFLEFDGPLVYTVEVANKLFLAYFWTYDPNIGATLLYCKTDPTDLEPLITNKIPIRDFLKKKCDLSEVYKVQFKQGHQLSCETVEFSEIEDQAPKPGIYLQFE